MAMLWVLCRMQGNQTQVGKASDLTTLIVPAQICSYFQAPPTLCSEGEESLETLFLHELDLRAKCIAKMLRSLLALNLMVLVVSRDPIITAISLQRLHFPQLIILSRVKAATFMKNPTQPQAPKAPFGSSGTLIFSVWFLIFYSSMLGLSCQAKSLF